MMTVISGTDTVALIGRALDRTAAIISAIPDVPALVREDSIGVLRAAAVQRTMRGDDFTIKFSRDGALE
jgi:hypothetical protein